MNQKHKIIIDWAIVLSLYFLVLLIIPFSHKFLPNLGEDTVNIILNRIIDVLIAVVFIGLLSYLIIKKKSSSLRSYIWFFIFFIITTYFLDKVGITKERLHFLGYGILSLFLYRALRHNIATQLLYLWSSLIVMLFAFFDEVFQMSGLGGRGFELKDIGIDWLSALLGQLLIALVVRPKLETVNIKLRHYMHNLERARIFTKGHLAKYRAHSVDIDNLAKDICLAFRKVTGHNSGHVYFKFKGQKHYLVLVCYNERVQQIVAKDKECQKGECIDWDNSEFANFSPKAAFLELFYKINTIIIDEPLIQREWHSFDEFQDWLRLTKRTAA